MLINQGGVLEASASHMLFLADGTAVNARDITVGQYRFLKPTKFPESIFQTNYSIK